MRFHSMIILLPLFLALLLSGCVSATDCGARYPHGRDDQIQGEIIIGFTPEATAEQIDAVMEGIGGRIVDEINLPNRKIRKVRLYSSRPEAVDEALERLRSDPDLLKLGVIDYAESETVRRAF